ncbi:MAG: serine kinase [Hyphomicrobiales bacterium]|nr:MAG: serine kinase [Hyphomicrobiales bacterium]
MNQAANRTPMADTPRIYRLFDLDVVSDIELAGVSAASGGGSGGTVSIIRRPPRPAPDVAPSDSDYVNDGRTQRLSWPQVGAFYVVSDDRIEVELNDDVDDLLASQPLLGAVFAALLHRRGLFLLHASALAVNGAGVALLGDKGAGKSTTAASLVAGGHQLVSDDLVALDFSDPLRPLILPAISQLKLWPDSAAALATLPLGQGARWHEAIDKASFPLLQPTAPAATPLRRIYLLNRAEQPRIEPIDAAQSVSLLLRFSYQAKRGEAGFGDRLQDYFARAGWLAGQGMVRKLVNPLGLDRLGEIAPLVEADLAATPSP